MSDVTARFHFCFYNQLRVSLTRTVQRPSALSPGLAGMMKDLPTELSRGHGVDLRDALRLSLFLPQKCVWRQ